MRNSSYSLIPILLKLNRLCGHAFKICMCRPVHLGPNDPRRKSNSLRKVMGSFSIS